MILSKSNIISSSVITLDVGAISSGLLANLQNPDFSKVLSSNSTTLEITVEGVGSSQFFALHGLSLPIGAVVSITGTGYSKSYTMVRDIKNLVFYVASPVTPGDMTIDEFREWVLENGWTECAGRISRECRTRGHQTTTAFIFRGRHPQGPRPSARPARQCTICY